MNDASGAPAALLKLSCTTGPELVATSSASSESDAFELVALSRDDAWKELERPRAAAAAVLRALRSAAPPCADAAGSRGEAANGLSSAAANEFVGERGRCVLWLELAKGIVVAPNGLVAGGLLRDVPLVDEAMTTGGGGELLPRLDELRGDW